MAPADTTWLILDSFSLSEDAAFKAILESWLDYYSYMIQASSLILTVLLIPFEVNYDFVLDRILFLLCVAPLT